MKRIILILALALMTGCATAPEVTPPSIIVAPCKAPPYIARPHLPVADLLDSSTYQEQLKAYALSVLLLQEYARQLEELLNGYRAEERNL